MNKVIVLDENYREYDFDADDYLVEESGRVTILKDGKVCGTFNSSRWVSIRFSVSKSNAQPKECPPFPIAPWRRQYPPDSWNKFVD